MELGDAGSVQLTVAPAQAGFNQIHLYLFDPGRPPGRDRRVHDARHEPAVGRPRAHHPRGRPRRPRPLPARRHDLALAGDWTIEVRARVDRFTEEAGATEVPIAP